MGSGFLGGKGRPCRFVYYIYLLKVPCRMGFWVGKGGPLLYLRPTRKEQPRTNTSHIRNTGILQISEIDCKDPCKVVCICCSFAYFSVALHLFSLFLFLRVAIV